MPHARRSEDAQPESRALEDRQPRAAETRRALAPARPAARVRVVGGPGAGPLRLALSLVSCRRAAAVAAEVGRGGPVLDARLGHLPPGPGHPAGRARAGAAGGAWLAVRPRRAAAVDVDLSAGVPQPPPRPDHARSGPAGGAVAEGRVGGEPVSPAIEGAAHADARRPA